LPRGMAGCAWVPRPAARGVFNRRPSASHANNAKTQIVPVSQEKVPRIVLHFHVATTYHHAARGAAR
jgi:hypothetical protein